MKKLVRNFVTSCHARKIRAKIQRRDEMFKQGHKHRFKCPSNQVEWKRLLAKGRMITDPSHILEYFRSYFEDLSSSKSPSNYVPNAQADLSNVENLSFLNDEKILDTMISIEEVEGAFKTMKQGRYGGGNGLDPEHIYYGGEVLKVWL